jgi:hypothetical protein
VIQQTSLETRTGRRRRALLPAAALITVLAAGCREPAAPGQAQDWELRSYEVAPADREPLERLLRSLLKDKGRIERGPDGRLVLLAAPQTHAQVQKEILEPLRARPSVPSARGPVSLAITYWMVLARPTRGKAAVATAAMPELGSVLQTIKQTAGAAELVLLERLRVTSVEGPAKTTGRTFAISQDASLVDGRVVSDIKIAGLFQIAPSGGIVLPRGEAYDEIISTRVNLTPGQTAIVGVLGLRGLPRGLPRHVPAPEGDETLFVILQASVDDVASR